MTHQEADAADAVAAIYPCMQVRFDDSFIECDVGALLRPDLGTINTLARLALSARRLDRRVCLRGTSPDLRELLTLTGLGDVLRTAALSALERPWRHEIPSRAPRQGALDDARRWSR